MDPQVYDRIAQGCMVAAVTSALLFDQTIGIFKITALLLGVAGGAGAIILYFWNQWRLVQNK